MNQASAPWPSHIHGCCSEHVVRERKVLRALFLIAVLSSVFWYCIFFCLSSADCRRREMWKVGFPDDSSFTCPPPYRGYRRWPFENRIHHLMRSFHPSVNNIVWGLIFRPPGKKFWKIISVFLRASPSSFLRKEPALRASPSVPSSFCDWEWQNHDGAIFISKQNFQGRL